jgi:hypothetical protein
MPGLHADAGYHEVQAPLGCNSLNTLQGNVRWLPSHVYT